MKILWLLKTLQSRMARQWGVYYLHAHPGMSEIWRARLIEHLAEMRARNVR